MQEPNEILDPAMTLTELISMYSESVEIVCADCQQEVTVTITKGGDRVFKLTERNFRGTDLSEMTCPDCNELPWLEYQPSYRAISRAAEAIAAAQDVLFTGLRKAA